MTMAEPFPGIWLPKQVEARVALALRDGHGRGALRHQLHRLQGSRCDRAREMSVAPFIAALAAALALAEAAAAQPAPTAPGVAPIAEIRVHGNHSTPDAEVIAVSGLAVGQASGESDLDAARERLRASGRFQSTEIRRRAPIDRRSRRRPRADPRRGAARHQPGSADARVAAPHGRRPDVGAAALLQRGLRVHLRRAGGGGRSVRSSGRACRCRSPGAASGAPACSSNAVFERGPVSRVVAGGDIVRVENPAFDLGGPACRRRGADRERGDVVAAAGGGGWTRRRGVRRRHDPAVAPWAARSSSTRGSIRPSRATPYG